MRKNKLFLICPCYNESPILEDSIKQLIDKFKELESKSLIDVESKIILIDDGSKDDTWDIIKENVNKNGMIGGIKLSKNFGQYAALMAGYMYAKDNADICISLDVDLQDDISILEELILEYEKGAEVVLAIRNERKGDSFIKKATAKAYYKVMALCGSNMIEEHPDFRLLSKKALNALSLFKDKKPYIRGIIPNLGFKTARVGFSRKKREGGTTCYNYWKLIRIAINGIVKTSNKLLGFPLVAAVAALLGCFIQIRSELYWVLLFLTLWIFGLYIADIKTQCYDYPGYIIDEII